MKNFFKLVTSTGNIAKYKLENASRMLIQNIHMNWLRSICSKKHKALTVFLSKEKCQRSNEKQIPFGFISHKISEYENDTVLEYSHSDNVVKDNTELKFTLVVPEQDVMQYFIQWQRYRKFWWSSITTTPSLFDVVDIKYGNRTAEVNIIARFPCGQRMVETVTINNCSDTTIKNSSCLSCSMTLESALFVLLLDGLPHSSDKKYLRLHRKMAPYKISFALDFRDSNNKQTLNELATLLYHKLEAKKISSWLPNFSDALESQLEENLLLGVAWTAILGDSTLEDGIFHLMNSSTMLKEQVHVADFESYAQLLCGK